MGTSNYYFIASLPALTFEGTPPMSSVDFCANSAAWISPGEHGVLCAVHSGEECEAHPAARKWQEWNNGFRNVMVVVRAARLSQDPAVYQHGTAGVDGYTRTAIQELIKTDNPLDLERGIDQLRWKYLDEQAAVHQFDFYILFSYLLQLMILERWAAFDTTRGEEVLNSSLAVSDAPATE
jgi:hypothetical protein